MHGWLTTLGVHSANIFRWIVDKLFLDSPRNMQFEVRLPHTSPFLTLTASLNSTPHAVPRILQMSHFGDSIYIVSYVCLFPPITPGSRCCVNPNTIFSGGTDVGQNRMEVHKGTQTFASLRQTLEEFKSAKISFSISSMTWVMIFFFFLTEQRMRYVV